MGQQAQDFFCVGSVFPPARANRSVSINSPALICLSLVRILKMREIVGFIEQKLIFNQWLTLLTKDLAASSMLTFSLADVSNQPANPCSFTYSSSLAGVVTIPCFCWSLWKGIASNLNCCYFLAWSYSSPYLPTICTESASRPEVALSSRDPASTWWPRRRWHSGSRQTRWTPRPPPCSTPGSCYRTAPDLFLSGVEQISIKIIRKIRFKLPAMSHSCSRMIVFWSQLSTLSAKSTPIVAR